MGKALSRRHLLRGAATAIGLPFLNAMVPSFARASTPPPRRMIVVYAPSGKIMPYWTPTETGTEFELPRTLKPLAAHRERVSVLSGLACHQGNALGDGAGDHARAASSYLTGVHPRKTEGADIHCGRSMDQHAAAHLASETRLPSLEITCEDSRQVGSCDSYSCVYQSISWKSETQPMPPEMNPRRAFERLFGDASLTPRQRRTRVSVLDYVREEAQSLVRDLGPEDRRKIDEYLTSVREVEARIAKAEGSALPDGAEAPAGIPTSYREHARLMFDLCELAFASDTTRVITFMLAREGGLQTYPEAGVPEAHHSCTHHREKPDLVEKVAKINEFHVGQFAYFLDRMHARQDGDGTLLDHTAAVYGAALGDPNVHDHDNLPTLLAGANALGRGGRHVRYEKGTPITNLHLTLLDYVGAPVDDLGDSNGRLELL
ncbi:MAG: DUF1552 domain-containing protein [Bryobacterales bacterium]|nr:DUF1552 domain-containing protein [Bryobacterales bacterium]